MTPTVGFYQDVLPEQQVWHTIDTAGRSIDGCFHRNSSRSAEIVENRTRTNRKSKLRMSCLLTGLTLRSLTPDVLVLGHTTVALKSAALKYAKQDIQ